MKLFYSIFGKEYCWKHEISSTTCRQVSLKFQPSDVDYQEKSIGAENVKEYHLTLILVPSKMKIR